MEISVLMRGIMMGFAIAAVVGPIGILCVQRTLSYGFLIGLAIGIGASFADAVYGAVAAFGFTAVKDFLIAYTIPLKIVGGVYLVYLGYSAYTTQPIKQKPMHDNVGIFNSITSSFFLTMTNPVTIIAFLSIFVSANLEHVIKDYYAASMLVIGVFVGSTIWWIILAGLSNLLRNKLTITMLSSINRISGLIIAAFGLFTFLSFLF